MSYSELMKLVKEFGIKREGYILTYKNYTVANIINHYNDIYRLDFISSYISTRDFDVAKKAATKRIKMIKELIVHNKKVELENDFQ